MRYKLLCSTRSGIATQDLERNYNERRAGPSRCSGSIGSVVPLCFKSTLTNKLLTHLNLQEVQASLLLKAWGDLI